MRIALLLLCLLLQKQPTTNKQSSQEQAQKPTTEQSTPEIKQPIRAADSQVRNEDHQEDERAQRVKEINDTLLVIFTGLLVLVGTLQAIAIFRQEKWMRSNVAVARLAAEAAKKSADVAESSLHLAERADVLLEGASFEHGRVMDMRDSKVVLRFKNFGRTKAKNVKLTLNLIVEGVPPTDSTQTPSVTIGAGDTCPISSQRFVEFMSQETAQGIFLGKTPLRFEASAVYQDIFDEHHRSCYSGTLDRATDVFRVDKQETD